MRTLLRFFAIVTVASLMLAGGTLAFASRAKDFVGANEGLAQDLQLDELATRSYVYAADGSLLGDLHAEQNREPVALDVVPQPVIDAILAIEDESFYEHGGVNLRATMRALVANVEAGEVEQGGSTITQQLVKNALLTPARDLDRKTREVALAVRLEREMSKEEILERYLNTVYFGGGAYGVQAAAEVYWAKDVTELGWPEAAVLAGLIANPTSYDPTLRPEAGRNRRAVVLDRLRELELITPEQATQISETELPTRRNINFLEAPPEDYFLEEVKQRLLRDERLGSSYQERYNQVFAGGLRIHTTLDPAAQAAALAARAEIMPEDERPFTAVIVSVEPSTGAVRAMVGGPGFESYKYNVATKSPGRQPGSSMKMFALVTALEQGYVLTDSVGGGGTFPNPGGSPYQISGRGGTLASITAASSNGAFVRLGTIVGQEEIIETARKMGMTSPMDAVLSLPLGVYDVIPIEMATAYGALANGGIVQPHHVVDRVEDRFGNLVFEGRPNSRRAVTRQTACLATQALEGVVRSGTGTRARVRGHRVAGKTGTTQENADAWFVGYTPHLATAVWMGAPDSRVRMNRVGRVGTVFGGTYPAMMFSHFMTAYHESLEPIDFPRCESARRGRFITAGGGSVTSTGTSPSPSPGPTPTTMPDEPDGTEPPSTDAPPTTSGPAPPPPPPPPPPTTGAPPPPPPPTTVGGGTPPPPPPSP